MLFCRGTLEGKKGKEREQCPTRKGKMISGALESKEGANIPASSMRKERKKEGEIWPAPAGLRGRKEEKREAATLCKSSWIVVGRKKKRRKAPNDSAGSEKGGRKAGDWPHRSERGRGRGIGESLI